MPAIAEAAAEGARSALAGDGTGTPYAPGDVLSRRFRIERVLGAGAMGIVVAARHLALDTRVAIKLMLPELRARKELVGRFLREARAAVRLDSRHVARVLDVGTLEDGAPFIVMEHLDGTDLASALREHGPVPAPRAAAIVRDASCGIAEAHALGIIHRDLKPANLFVTRAPDGEPLVKVLDLGVCRLTGDTDDLRDTSIAGLIGTPLYMAPEQLRSGRDADARSDIWSLGVILYELVTGRVPFRGRTVADQCVRAMRDPYPAMNRRDVPRAFEAVVARCLAKDPSARFQRVTELADALAVLARGSPRGTRAARAMRSRWLRGSVIAGIGLALGGALGLRSPPGGEPVTRPGAAACRPLPPAISAPPPAISALSGAAPAGAAPSRRSLPGAGSGAAHSEPRQSPRVAVAARRPTAPIDPPIAAPVAPPIAASTAAFDPLATPN